MTRPAAAARVHVVGARLAGLSAAVTLAGRGVPVVLSDAARQAGGRCRSYHDGVLDMEIDNGNHLVLSGNPAVGRYLGAIGAADRVSGPSRAEFPFFDVPTGRSWTLRPNDGPIPWWILAAGRRVPGTRFGDYLAVATLMRRHAGRRIEEVLPCRGVLWEKFLRPLLVSILNTAPEEASADLAGAVMRETLAKGGGSIRPRVAMPSLTAAFVEPALHRLRQSGAEIRLGRRLSNLKLKDGRVSGLTFVGGDELRQERQEEDRQFRIEDVDQKSRHDHAPGRAFVEPTLDRERALLAQRLPGHIEKIDHAEPFQRRERQRAGVQHRGEPSHRGQHRRQDAERAAERRGNTGLRPLGQRRRQRVEHAGARRRDHDQRSQ